MKTTNVLLICFILLTGIGWGGTPLMGASSTTLMPAIPTAWGHSWGIGARDMGMGGAFSAVGGDYSALYYNPAGLGTIERPEVFGTLSRLSVSTDVDFLGVKGAKSTDMMKFNALGFSFPLPTSRGSMVFSLGYHRVRQFDNALFASLFHPTEGDSGVTWNNRQVEKGWMSNWAFGGAVEVAPGVFLGGSLQWWSGKNDFTWMFQEMDQPFNLYEFSQFDSTDHILTTFSGLNLSLGAFFQSEHLRLGGSLSSPFTLKCSEHWSYRDVTTWDADLGYPMDVVSDRGNPDYKIQLPLSLRGGMALTYGPVLVSGDAEMINYNQMEYKTDPSIEFLDETTANMAIQDNLRNVLNYHIGGEVAVPNTPAKIRAGYAVIKTPYLNVPYEKDRKVFSFGAGFTFSDQLALDVGYAATKWEGAPDDMISKRNVKAAQVLVSVSYRK